MALQPSPPIDVPLSVVDQISPVTSGPVGRLTRLLDAQVTKFQAPRVAGTPTAVRVDKRDAFFTLADTVRNTSDGSVQMGATLTNQTLLTEFQNRLLLVSNDDPLVYSESSVAWEKHGYQLTTDTLTQSYVHTSNTLATTPDKAINGEGVRCHVWVNEASFNSGGGAPSELAGCYYTVVDQNGVTLRSPTRFSTIATRTKVVSDGGYFWIFGDKGDGTANIVVQLVDINGLNLQSFSFPSTYSNGDTWDCTYTPGYGVAFAQSHGSSSAQVQVVLFSYNSTTNTITANAGYVSIAGTGFSHPSWITNDTFDGFGYLSVATHIGTNNNTITAYQLNATPAIATTMTVATGQDDEPANITGYVVPGQGGDIVVAFSLIDNTAAPNTNYLKNIIRQWYVPHSGTPTFICDLRSMNLASRAYGVRGSYYFVGYYPSHTIDVSASEQLPNQPTYFLCPMMNPTQNTAGRFDYGVAYCDWQSSGSKYNFSLASVVSDFPSGMSTALSYRAESVTTTSLNTPTRIHFGLPGLTTQVTTVGVKEWNIGPGHGESVSYGSTILLPGPQATMWSGGDFSESNISLAFEQPTLTVNSTTGTPPALTAGTYQYIAVGEWTDNNGDRMRSMPSPAATIIVGAGQYVTVAGYMMHATNKKDLLISLYRTDMLPDSGGGYVTSTEHYKITVDGPTTTDSPLYNDPNQDTWSFNDSLVGITANEILYTDKGMLANMPAPAFSRGCVWLDRVFVIGPDNAIWFSAEKTEGDALWFYGLFRMVLPTNDPPTAIAATTEGYLLVFCENSIWYYPASTFPDSSGANGTIPSATELKFNMGCTGEAIVTKLGTVYSSSAGGLWVVTRDLQNQWLSEPISDDLNGPVSALSVDSRQRIYAVSGGLFAYDTISSCWYEWSPPSVPTLLTTYRGALTYCDDSIVWKQQLQGITGYDSKYQGGVSTTYPYFTQVKINFMHFGGVRNYKRMWAYQGVGDVTTPSTVTLDMAYDDDPTVLESKPFTTTAGRMVFECKPQKQLCSSIGVTITESLTGSQTPGQGFSLELLSFYVGLEPKGLNRVPILQRV